MEQRHPCNWPSASSSAGGGHQQSPTKATAARTWASSTGVTPASNRFAATAPQARTTSRRRRSRRGRECPGRSGRRTASRKAMPAPRASSFPSPSPRSRCSSVPDKGRNPARFPAQNRLRVRATSRQLPPCQTLPKQKSLSWRSIHERASGAPLLAMCILFPILLELERGDCRRRVRGSAACIRAADRAGLRKTLSGIVQSVNRGAV